MKFVPVLMLFTAFFITENLAEIKCYTCSAGDETCSGGKKSNNFTSTACTVSDDDKNDGANVKCFKTVKLGKFKRGCAVDGGSKKYCEEEMKKDKDIKCFLCEKELCNSTDKIYMLKTFPIILLASINIFMKKFLV